LHELSEPGWNGGGRVLELTVDSVDDPSLLAVFAIVALGLAIARLGIV
jgi:hypothetical protein